MSKLITATVPDNVYDFIKREAERIGTPVSWMTQYFLKQGVALGARLQIEGVDDGNSKESVH